MWNKNALDVAGDRLSGGTEPLVDPIMEALEREVGDPGGRKGKRRK